MLERLIAAKKHPWCLCAKFSLVIKRSFLYISSFLFWPFHLPYQPLCFDAAIIQDTNEWWLLFQNKYIFLYSLESCNLSNFYIIYNDINIS